MSKTDQPALGSSPDMWGAAAVSPAAGAARGAWFRESRYAMFVHWGLYSEAAGVWRDRTYYVIAEWLMHAARIPVRDYETLCARFNPVEFDARAWVQLARDAGMKYLVITAKHHDGFAMFKSRASAYNIVDATPFGRDPLQELAVACRAGGLKLGFYYSQFQDWHEPDAGGNTWDFGEPRDFDRYLRAKAMPQIEELLTNYGPIGLIWFDTPGHISRAASQELLDLVRRLQPDCLVNSRIGNGLGEAPSEMSDVAPPAITDPRMSPYSPAEKAIVPAIVCRTPVGPRSMSVPSGDVPLYMWMAVYARTLPAILSFPLGPAAAPRLTVDSGCDASIA